MIVICLSVIELVDWFELPFESFFVASTATVLPVFSNLISVLMLGGSYLGLFVLMFLENMLLPIPSEVFLPLAGYFVFLGKMSLPLAIGVSTIAGLGGNLVAYFLALRFGPPVVYSLATKMGISQKTLAKWEVRISGKYGSGFVLAARFVPGIRASITLVAGVLRMKLGRFSLMTLLGSFGWSATLIYLGLSTGPLWKASGSAFIATMSNDLPAAMLVAATSYILVFIAHSRYTLKK